MSFIGMFIECNVTMLRNLLKSLKAQSDGYLGPSYVFPLGIDGISIGQKLAPANPLALQLFLQILVHFLELVIVSTLNHAQKHPHPDASHIDYY
jgi:hypothetical protein